MIPYAKRSGRNRKMDNLPPDAYPVLNRMLIDGYCIPYIKEQIEKRFDCVLPTLNNIPKYRIYEIENNISKPNAYETISYAVSALIDPDRPFRNELEILAKNDESLSKICRVLRNMGAPLSDRSRDIVMSAIKLLGIEYTIHKKGGRQ